MGGNYHIPANYTDAGKLLGMFEIRNTVEAVIIAAPLFYGCFKLLPFSLTGNLIITMILVIPAGGFTLLGVNDGSLTVFLRIWRSWLKNKGVLTYKGDRRLQKRSEVHQA